MQSILSVSPSVSRSPVLHLDAHNDQRLNMGHTPIEGRIQISSKVIQQVATAAGPTPTISTSSYHARKQINASSLFQPCILCGKSIKNNEKEHYHDCFKDVKDLSIISSLDSTKSCTFCKSNWITKEVSASYKINHMKSCADSYTYIAEYLRSLKCERHPETPIISDESKKVIDS